MAGQSHETPTPLLRAVEQQVARVLNHQSFSRSQGPARLLLYLLQKLTRCGGQPATQQELATVLQLPAGFNPASNPLVRMHMSKLRKMLRRYATGDGRDDLVRLEIPRNRYQLKAVVNADRTKQLDTDAADPRDDSFSRPVMLVAEFDFKADGGRNPATDMAFQLVAMLAEDPRVAAIGPALRSRLRSDGLDVRQFAKRCRARLVLDGEILPDRRGLTLVARVLDVATGEACWSDWLDEPSTGVESLLGEDPAVLAARMLDKLLSFDALGQCVRGASDQALAEPNVRTAAS